MTQSVKPAKPVIVSLIPEKLMRPKLLEGLRAIGELHFETDPRAGFCDERSREASILIGAHYMQVHKSLLDCFPKLEMTADYGVGFDGYELSEFARRGIALSNTPDVLSRDVADFGFALLLTLTRRTAEADAFVRAGRWPNEDFGLGRRIFGKRIGIAGLGRIGSVLAQRAAAFEMEVGYTARHEKPVPYKRFADMKSLAQWADFLVVVIPGSPETRHLVNAEVLDALGPQGMLINIARGALVDTEALIRALQEGRIAGAALDVFEHEPHVEEALLGMKNVVLAPHIASGTFETRDDMADLVLENVRSFLAGKPLLTRVPGSTLE